MNAPTEQYDLVLTNGRVIDPETDLDGKFNVGINGGQIAAISDQPLKGKEVVDVAGMIVSPGFIDMHSHGMNVACNRLQAFDGVTTALELEGGALPVGEFYDNCAKAGMAINYGISAGWASGRIVTLTPEQAMDGKPPANTVPFVFNCVGIKECTQNVANDDQVDKIIEWTEQGLKEGGIGIGVLHAYFPGAGPKELTAVWELAAKYNVPTYTHTANISMLDPKSGVASMLELAGLAAATGAHTHVCHMNSVAMRDIPRFVAIVKNAQKQGIKMTAEAYTYGAGNSSISAAEFNPDDVEQRMGVHFNDFTLVKTNKAFKNKEEYVAEMNASPNDAVIIHFLDEDNNAHDASLLDMSVLFPGGAVITDALPATDAKGDWYLGSEWPLPAGLQNHPRAAGGYSRFLRKWVRERQVISWMDAIAKCSLIPAQIIEDAAPMMKKKGRLQEGCDADIIVFDPTTVTDKATFKDPILLSEGMKHVIVNGNFLIRDTELDTKAMPGQAVRGPIRD